MAAVLHEELVKVARLYNTKIAGAVGWLRAANSVTTPPLPLNSSNCMPFSQGYSQWLSAVGAMGAGPRSAFLRQAAIENTARGTSHIFEVLDDVFEDSDEDEAPEHNNETTALMAFDVLAADAESDYKSRCALLALWQVRRVTFGLSFPHRVYGQATGSLVNGSDAGDFCHLVHNCPSHTTLLSQFHELTDKAASAGHQKGDAMGIVGQALELMATTQQKVVDHFEAKDSKKVKERQKTAEALIDEQIFEFDFEEIGDKDSVLPHDLPLTRRNLKLQAHDTSDEDLAIIDNYLAVSGGDEAVRLTRESDTYEISSPFVAAAVPTSYVTRAPLLRTAPPLRQLKPFPEKTVLNLRADTSEFQRVMSRVPQVMYEESPFPLPVRLESDKYRAATAAARKGSKQAAALIKALQESNELSQETAAWHRCTAVVVDTVYKLEEQFLEVCTKEEWLRFTGLLQTSLRVGLQVNLKINNDLNQAILKAANMPATAARDERQKYGQNLQDDYGDTDTNLQQAQHRF